MKYVKKPEIVDAIQYYPGMVHEFICMMGHGLDHSENPSPHVHIRGDMLWYLKDADYIVTFIDGAREVYSSYVFYQMYEQVDGG